MAYRSSSLPLSVLSAKDVMNPHAIPLVAGTFERDMVMQFLSGQYDGWPVVDSNRTLIGLVREDRLLEVMAEEQVCEGLRVQDVMSVPPCCVSIEDPVEGVLKQMVQHHLLRVPVVEGQRVVGVISRQHLLRQRLLSGAEPFRLLSACLWCERVRETDHSGSNGNRWRDGSSWVPKDHSSFRDAELSHVYCEHCHTALQAITRNLYESSSGKRKQTDRPPAILVVDDDSSVRGMVGEALKEWGYDVHLVGSGREGLMAVESNPPDGILLDLDMPVMNGRTMLDELRWLGYRMPVVMISGGMDYKELRQFLKEGAQGILLKPFPLSKLKQVCKRFFTANVKESSYFPSGATSEAREG
jgi:CheY-like chemotaxis protein/CBS domain-containing protein